MKSLPLPILLSLAVNAPAVVTLADPGQEVFDFTANAAELSGLTWLTGTTYHAVSDAANQRKVYELNIAVNPANGHITEASLTQSLTLAAGFDLEGIAWSRPRGTWFVSDEGTPPTGGVLREHTLPDGNLVRAYEIPAPLEKARANFSLESCTWGAGALWTANEEALSQESALSTATSGSLIRLQKFDHLLNPAGQWAYQTDSFGFDSPLTTSERSGVVDLLALPDGNLLVLERALGIGFFPSFRNRIYLVDFTEATDVGGVADLDETAFTPVTKTLLWEKNFGSITTRNFEGLALGPALPLISSTSFSVLLVADNGNGTQQHLHALIVHGVAAPPPIAQWRQGWWGTTAATGPAAYDADPDGDGVANLLEYAFGGNPLDSARTPLPQPGSADGRLALTFNRNLTNTDLTITVQATDSLKGSWIDLAESVSGTSMTALLGGIAVTETGTGATRRVEIQDPAQISEPAQQWRFMRVKVSHPSLP